MADHRRQSPDGVDAKQTVLTSRQVSILMSFIQNRLMFGYRWMTIDPQWHLNGIRGLVRRRLVQQAYVKVKDGGENTAVMYAIAPAGVSALQHFMTNPSLYTKLASGQPDSDGVYEPPPNSRNPDDGLTGLEGTELESKPEPEKPEPESWLA